VQLASGGEGGDDEGAGGMMKGPTMKNLLDDQGAARVRLASLKDYEGEGGDRGGERARFAPPSPFCKNV